MVKRIYLKKNERTAINKYINLFKQEGVSAYWMPDKVWHDKT